MLSGPNDDDEGKIYGVYTGSDRRSYICELRGTGGPIPAYRMMVANPLSPPTQQDLHVSTFWGSVTLILGGALEIGVTAGELRKVVGKAGDIFVLIDTEGDGHTAARTGSEPLQHLNIRLREPWAALSAAFTWPDNVLPPKEYAPPVNY